MFSVIALVVLFVIVAMAVTAPNKHSGHDYSVPSATANRDMIVGPTGPPQDPILPDEAMTPGDTSVDEGGSTDANVVCHRSTKTVRNVTVAEKKQVYDAYAAKYRTQTWAQHTPGHYEVDHLISLELGGSNDVKNLWPESYLSHPYNAHIKDKLENILHAKVCSGQMDLATAQKIISHDWVTAYETYAQ